MDKLEKAYYEVTFENKFLKAKGDSFQILFNELMGRAYKGDYMPSRPWGNRGDRKNDGFLKSDRRLFQVYAPIEMTETVAIQKITEDFEGAKHYWGKYFDKWSFVHNAYNGLPPHVQEVILQFEHNNPGIKLDPWSFEELLVIFRRVEKDDLVSWLGYAPSAETKAKLGFSDIQVVLESITSRKPDSRLPVKQVPTRKIEANQLSDAIATLIKEGMTKSSVVAEFFAKWHDPAFGERVSAAFRERYNTLRGTMTPNEIFYDFQTWVGGAERGSAEHEMAVFAVMAYFFETCDIFEEPGDRA